MWLCVRWKMWCKTPLSGKQGERDNRAVLAATKNLDTSQKRVKNKPKNWKRDESLSIHCKV